MSITGSVNQAEGFIPSPAIGSSSLADPQTRKPTRAGEKKGRTMNRLSHFKEATPPFIIAIVLGSFGLLPQMQAVVPPPDGCYPGFTTAEGCDALNSLTTGAGNTAIGWRSLFFNTDADFNTGVGGGALALNNADSNTAVGAAALLLNTSGFENTAVGTDGLVHNDSGEHNTAVGAFALFNNVTGDDNTALGRAALFSNVHGGRNNAFGLDALRNNESGLGGGSFNNAHGSSALGSNTTGSSNNAFGDLALQANVTGTGNTPIGDLAGEAIVGDRNICIGSGVVGSAADNNTVRIADNLPIAGPAQCFIGGIISTPVVTGDPVVRVIPGTNQLGVTVSSARFKENIKPMDNASEAIYALNPVTFRYKKQFDAKRIRQFGLVAEEVAKVNPDLVALDPDGKPFTVRYEEVNALLLNEFLKEHRKVEELEATVAQQRKDFRAAIAKLQENVTAQLKEQAAQIQKVSDELQLNRPAPFLVGNK
jgi:hypothetical protein